MSRSRGLLANGGLWWRLQCLGEEAIEDPIFVEKCGSPLDSRAFCEVNLLSLLFFLCFPFWSFVDGFSRVLSWLLGGISGDGSVMAEGMARGVR